MGDSKLKNQAFIQKYFEEMDEIRADVDEIKDLVENVEDELEDEPEWLSPPVERERSYVDAIMTSSYGKKLAHGRYLTRVYKDGHMVDDHRLWDRMEGKWLPDGREEQYEYMFGHVPPRINRVANFDEVGAVTMKEAVKAIRAFGKLYPDQALYASGFSQDALDGCLAAADVIEQLVSDE